MNNNKKPQPFEGLRLYLYKRCIAYANGFSVG